MFLRRRYSNNQVEDRRRRGFMQNIASRLHKGEIARVYNANERLWITWHPIYTPFVQTPVDEGRGATGATPTVGLRKGAYLREKRDDQNEDDWKSHVQVRRAGCHGNHHSVHARRPLQPRA